MARSGTQRRRWTICSPRADARNPVARLKLEVCSARSSVRLRGARQAHVGGQVAIPRRASQDALCILELSTLFGKCRLDVSGAGCKLELAARRKLARLIAKKTIKLDSSRRSPQSWHARAVVEEQRDESQLLGRVDATEKLSRCTYNSRL